MFQTNYFQTLPPHCDDLKCTSVFSIQGAASNGPDFDQTRTPQYPQGRISSSLEMSSYLETHSNRLS